MYKRCLSSGELFSSFKKELPRLPLPSLSQTCLTLIKSAEPFCSPEELVSSKHKINKFIHGIGQNLQQLLEKRAQEKENWSSDLWLQLAYLKNRHPLPIWSSPGMTWPKMNFRDKGDMIQFGAKIVAGALDFRKAVKNGSLVYLKGKSLDSQQYSTIFGATRIPRMIEDSQSFTPESCHITVMYRSNLYSLTVIDKYGMSKSQGELRENLKEILNFEDEPGVPFGLLTTDSRDNWSVAHQLLSLHNAESLLSIQTSLFVLCLDGKGSLEVSEKEQLRERALYSLTGSMTELGNRWFDKCLQFYVCEDGSAGLTYEHSPAEGTIVMDLANYILNFNSDGCEEKGKFNSSPLKLRFMTNDAIQKAIELATANYENLTKTLDIVPYHFKNYGKNYIKSCQLSPDSWIQMAMQLAYWKIHSFVGSHYETGGTKKFLHGRTDVIRSCSMDSLYFVKTVSSHTCTLAQKWESMKTAILTHSQYSEMVRNGFGIDRHLQGLEQLAEIHGFDISNLIENHVYHRSLPQEIRSSQVSGASLAFFTTGPPNLNSYCTRYNLRPEDIFLSSSSFLSGNKNSNEFNSALISSLEDMKTISSFVKRN